MPEAPRLIGDLVGTYEKLPFHLQAKGEFEYVGRKVVGNGCSEASYLSGDPNALNYYCLGVPNKEFRFAAARPFLDGRLNLGVNTMIASGWTGQTVENFAAAGVFGPGLVGLGQRRTWLPANPVSEVVGVRIPSYASVNLTYHFGVRPRAIDGVISGSATTRAAIQLRRVCVNSRRRKMGSPVARPHGPHNVTVQNLVLMR